MLLLRPPLLAEPKSWALPLPVETVAVEVVPELGAGVELELTEVVEDEVEVTLELLLDPLAHGDQVVTTQPAAEPVVELDGLVVVVLVVVDVPVPAGTTQLLPDIPTLLHPAVSLTKSRYSAAIASTVAIAKKSVVHNVIDRKNGTFTVDIMSKPPC